MRDVRTLQFIALTLTALALVPAGAHILALPNKIALAQIDYFIAQSVYRGWALLGIVLIGAIFADLALTVALRGQGTRFWLALAGFVCIAATLAIFFAWTFPANRATDNWTAVPDNWRQLRAQWEYAHAAGAGLTFAGFCALLLSVLVRRA